MNAQTCPEHGIPLRPACVDGRDVIVCLACALSGHTAYQTVPERLPDGLDGRNGLSGRSGRGSGPARRGRPEEGVQEAILEALAAVGLVVRVPREAEGTLAPDVLITSRRRRPCPECGHMDTRGDGCSPGLPDLLLWSEALGAWVGMEVKGPTTEVRPAQQALLDAGRIAVVRSAASALNVARGQRFGIEAALEELP